MFEIDNLIQQEDLEIIAKTDIIEQFRDKTILVTGATGLIGSEAVLACLCANRLKNLNIKIVALARNEEKVKNSFKNVIENKNLEFLIQNVCSPIVYDKKVDFIIHTAGMTNSKNIIDNPIECIKTTLEGTKNVLEFAKANGASVCYLSSIEVYGKVLKKDVAETDYGILDSTNLRNAYPISKKLAENLCIAFSKNYNVNTKIARLTQTFGAGIAKDENRVFAQFARNIINGEDIILHTDGKSSKNYCYITDAIIALFTMLIKGCSGEVYNVANYNSYISIKDLAKLLSNKYKTSKVKTVRINDNRYPATTKIKLNSKKLEKLGWRASIGIEEMFDRLIKSLKEAL